MIEKIGNCVWKGDPERQKLIVGESDINFVCIHKVALLALRLGPKPSTYYFQSISIYPKFK